MSDTQQRYMHLALALAAKGALTCPPNPQVGCIIVNQGHIVGQGYHVQTGGPHAEIHALNEAKALAQGADVYVTLEPCSHYGRTPPCVDALIQAGVKRVTIPFSDPNPRVNGQGINQLRAAGIEVITGVCAEAAAFQNRRFLTYALTQKPYIIAKWAMTEMGQLYVPGQPFITHEAARMHAHRLRQQVDAILVGRSTVAIDNPQLTNRYVDIAESLCRQPIRLIISSSRDVPLHLHIADPNLPGETWWLSPAALPAKTAGTIQHKILPGRTDIPPRNTDLSSLRDETVLPLIRRYAAPTPARGEGHPISMDALLTFLGEQGITSVLVEGGATTLSWFFEENAVDEAHVYINTEKKIALPVEKQPFLQELLAFTETDTEVIAGHRWTQYVRQGKWTQVFSEEESHYV